MEGRVRCRRCRVVLLGRVVVGGGGCCATWEEVLGISADGDNDYPPWVIPCLDEGDWIKGKLSCPGCKTKLGAFNFVGGPRCRCKSTQVPDIYLVLAKVDVDLYGPPITTPPPALPTQSTPTLDSTITSTDSFGASISNEQISTANRSIVPELNNTDLLPSKYKKTHRKSLSWHGNVTIKLNKWIGNLFSGSNPDISTKLPSTDCNSAETMAIPEGTSPHGTYAPSRDPPDIPYEYQCSVCLELLCVPRACDPCGHVFCEPCLRLVAQAQGDFHTCPLCRFLIFTTIPRTDVEAELLEKEEDKYRLRLVWYNSLPQHVHFLPLPGVGGGGWVGGVWRQWRSARPAISAMCLSLLCLLFFFCLFVPGVYISSSLYEYLVELEPVYPRWSVVEEVREWAASLSPLLPSLLLTSTSILLLYLLFML